MISYGNDTSFRCKMRTICWCALNEVQSLEAGAGCCVGAYLVPPPGRSSHKDMTVFCQQETTVRRSTRLTYTHTHTYTYTSEGPAGQRLMTENSWSKGSQSHSERQSCMETTQRRAQTPASQTRQQEAFYLVQKLQY